MRITYRSDMIVVEDLCHIGGGEGAIKIILFLCTLGNMIKVVLIFMVLMYKVPAPSPQPNCPLSSTVLHHLYAIIFFLT